MNFDEWMKGQSSKSNNNCLSEKNVMDMDEVEFEEFKKAVDFSFEKKRVISNVEQLFYNKLKDRSLILVNRLSKRLFLMIRTKLEKEDGSLTEKSRNEIMDFSKELVSTCIREFLR